MEAFKFETVVKVERDLAAKLHISDWSIYYCSLDSYNDVFTVFTDRYQPLRAKVTGNTWFQGSYVNFNIEVPYMDGTIDTFRLSLSPGTLKERKC